MLDRRSGHPIQEKRLLTRDTRTETYYPATIALQRNEIISGKINPITRKPMWLETNLINDVRDLDMQIWDSERSGTGVGAFPDVTDFSDNRYWTTTGGGDGKFLAFENRGNPRRATRYYITVENGYTPRSWRFEASNDGIIWVTLHSYVQLDTWPDGLSQHKYDIPVENQDYYTCFRIIIDACDVTDVRIRNFIVCDNEETTDCQVKIKASETDPLILSFANGTATHVVTLTEDRIVDGRGLPSAQGKWEYARKNFVTIAAEYNPTTGLLTFGTDEQEVTPADGTGYKSYLYKYGTGTTYGGNPFDFDGTYYGGKSNYNNYARATVTILPEYPNSDFLFYNKLLIRTLESSATGGIRELPGTPSGYVDDIDNNDTLSPYLDLITTGSSKEGIYVTSALKKIKKLQFRSETSTDYRNTCIYHLKAFIETALTLRMLGDGKIYAMTLTGDLTHRIMVPIGSVFCGNVVNGLDYETYRHDMAGRISCFRDIRPQIGGKGNFYQF